MSELPERIYTKPLHHDWWPEEQAIAHDFCYYRYDVVEQLTKELNEVVAKHTQQIKDRVPLEIAERIDCWPRALTCVSQLKQERNNADVEVEKLQAEVDRLRDALGFYADEQKYHHPLNNVFCEILSDMGGLARKALQSSDTKERNLRQELYDTAHRRVAEQLTPWPKQPLDNGEPDITKPPCLECGAMTAKEAETKCICGGDKDDCHGCELWPDSGEE
jgi:septum formation topological specificity factor MinE